MVLQSFTNEVLVVMASWDNNTLNNPVAEKSKSLRMQCLFISMISIHCLNMPLFIIVYKNINHKFHLRHCHMLCLKYTKYNKIIKVPFSC